MRKKTKEEYIIKFNEKHNNYYDYSLMNYITASIKIKIICPKHGIFEQRPIDHRFSGCPKCKKIQLDDFLNRANNMHKNYYDYSLIKEIKNNKQKVKIICPKHGIFEQRIDGHLKGIGCKKCADESYIIGPYKFIENSNITHRNKYNYSLIFDDYINQHSKIKIICPMHGIFEQSACNHSSMGNGCPICKISNGEIIIRDILIKNDILIKEQKYFKDCIYKKYLFFDFYLPEYNICIEYDGEQHFKSVEYFGGEKTFEENKIRDNIKNEYCKNNNIHLIRISYKEKIEEKLNYELASFLNKSALF